MPEAKQPAAAATETATCSWNDCSETAVTSVALDYGQTEACETCGRSETQRMQFPMCQDHSEQFTATGDTSVLIINATGAMA